MPSARQRGENHATHIHAVINQAHAAQQRAVAEEAVVAVAGADPRGDTLGEALPIRLGVRLHPRIGVGGDSGEGGQLLGGELADGLHGRYPPLAALAVTGTTSYATGASRGVRFRALARIV
jgi:hypothetical protein